MRQLRFTILSTVAVVGVAAAVVVCGRPALASRRVVRTATSHRPSTLTRPDTLSVKTVRHVVRPRETLTSILRTYRLGGREAARWYTAMGSAAGTRLLSPGHVLTLQFDRAGRLILLNYDVDDRSRVIIERIGSRLLGRTEPLAVTVTPVGAQGVIEKNFHLAARRAGIPDRIISQMADILGWEFDFRRVQPGDRFRVVYERRVSTDGRALTPGKVLVAEIRSTRRTVQAFYYDDGVEGTYVDATGRVLAQSFLRYPVEFTQVSSVFSGSRLHPILKHARPHHGVDFAAPPGTPVRAASDGAVSSAGWNGEFGYQVVLRHGNGVVTTYSHLRGIARGLRPGLAVRQGQVIGSVGQTGLATGPHLHFALFRDGKYLNPLTAQVPLRRSVSDAHRFQLAKLDLLQRLASATQPPAPVPVEPTMLASLPAARRLGIVTITQ